MLVPLRWLRDYVDFDMKADDLAELLTMTGTKVESVTRVGDKVQGIISARIEEISSHPSESRLKVAKLSAGRYSYTVVTAAKNVEIGDVVPLAAPGAVLCDGRLIREAEFSGIKSEGMMCSAMELGISEDAEGIMILSDSCLTGLDLVSVLELQDEVLELEITPNRPDCLGMLGVAREVAAITRNAIKWPELEHPERGEHISRLAWAEVLEPEYCSRYALRLFSDVKVAPSPIWMQVRLKAAGIRPISNIVDVTNYVMLDVNQPLHAFDFDRIEGGKIIVRRALEGEKITTLDGQDRPVEEGMLLICDTAKPVAVAGVMGGAESEIGPGTKRVLLESANFLRQSVWKTSKLLKLRTESSSRFEKGLDVETIPLALDRSANLLAYMGAATVHPGIVDVNNAPSSTRIINTSRGWISRKLGTELGSKVDDYLTLLGLEVEPDEFGDGIAVDVPTWRADLQEPIDLAEEVARLHGYDNLKAKVPENSKPSSWTDAQIAEKRIKSVLTSAGIHEAMTYSMVPCDEYRLMRLDVDEKESKPIIVSNPLSEDQSAMRTMLLPSLLRVAGTNHRRGAGSVRVFEISKVYIAGEGGLTTGELQRGEVPAEEIKMLAAVLSGSISGCSTEKSWHSKERQVDFYDAKGVIESLLYNLGINEWSIEKSSEPYLRPGRAADVYIKGKKVGSFGQIHPDTAASFDVPEEAVGLEIQVLPLLESIRWDMRFKGIPKYPSTIRDIAMIAYKEVSSETIREAIIEKAGAFLESVSVFDIYEGKNIPEGSRSLAFSLKYRSADRTLTTEEVNDIHEKVREELKKRLGVTLR